MNGTQYKPTLAGWYWYQEAGKNFDKPMTVWVFGDVHRLYACRFGPHELPEYREAHQLDECPGLWLGPIEPPKEE